MKIIYQHEFGQQYLETDTTIVPRKGETVQFDETFYVSDVSWHPVLDTVYVILTDEIRNRESVAENNSNHRLNQLHNAIIQTNKRQDAMEKSSRQLTEQVVNVKRHINNRIQQERKNNES